MSNYTIYNFLDKDVYPPLPFDIKLSFEHIFKFWQGKAEHGTVSDQIQARAVLESVAHAPVLKSPITDLSILETHSQEISILLSAIFPDMISGSEIKAASLPFVPVVFNLSEKFKQVLSKSDGVFQYSLKDLNRDEVYRWACSRVLESIYQVPVKFRHPLNVDIPNVELNSVHHYKVTINKDFSIIKTKPDATLLSSEDIQTLLDNSQDIDLWRRLIPPGTYELEGIHFVTLFDQTEEESLSEIKELLLESDALRDEHILEQVEFQLAKYLNIPEVNLGFDAFDERGGIIRAFHGSTASSKLLEGVFDSPTDDWHFDTSFGAWLSQQGVYAVSRVEEMVKSTSYFIRVMHEKGVGSFIIAPLSLGRKSIAFIELTSPQEGILNSMVATKLKNVLPVISMVVERTLNHHQMQLEAIIQDKFTSLHPTVNWRFLQAAESIFQNQGSLKSGDTDIVFKDVYPLYGQFDIRGSSEARNAAILADMQEQVNLAKGVLKKAFEIYQLPIYKQMLYRVESFTITPGDDLHTSDEGKVLDYMRQELDAVFRYLKSQPNMEASVNAYFSELDPNLGVVYKQRKAYEESVNQINEVISDYISHQQDSAQSMFPHYFDKFKSDGVEYNAFIGQSLVQTRSLDLLHLKNLRLWQLLMVCGVERVQRTMIDELPMPLEVTPLVLAYSASMAIRFRLDEKRFDIDGAYNSRFEILKKRIEKVCLKDSPERLTQPGKLAIVYSQESEREEYLQYIRYLQACGYLYDDLERLALEDLPGASGLQALRVGLKGETSPDDLIKEMLESMETHSN